MIEILAYEPSHLSEIRVKAIHQGEVPKSVRSYARTLMHMQEKTPLAIFGGYNVTPTCLFVWALISDSVHRFPVDFHKTCLKLLESYKCPRIQIDVRCDYLEGVRWARSLGFRCEGIMEKYGADGSDHFLMAKVIR